MGRSVTLVIVTCQVRILRVSRAGVVLAGTGAGLWRSGRGTARRGIASLSSLRLATALRWRTF